MSGTWFDLVVFIIYIIVLFLVVVDNFRVRIKNTKLNSEVERHILEYMVIANKLQELKQERSEKNIEQTEGFLKFVSQSRDWAFAYIETAQAAIEELKMVASKAKLGKEHDELKKAIAEVIRNLPDDHQGEK